ncbi:MAG: hypothetical protein KGJ62_13735 [Armatimonadetes bacterium]|nr:hypothetical protein [Armatimonadota bacterium]MDE2207628.1 hypothetical protein [Armatimonadota bacterium]
MKPGSRYSVDEAAPFHRRATRLAIRLASFVVRAVCLLVLAANLTAILALVVSSRARALHSAAADGDLPGISRGLRDGVPVDARTFGIGGVEAPIAAAATTDRVRAVRLLVSRGADPGPGLTAALFWRKWASATVILMDGRNFSRRLLNTCVWSALGDDRPEIAHLALLDGGDLNSVGPNGASVLECAMDERAAALVRFILQHTPAARVPSALRLQAIAFLHKRGLALGAINLPIPAGAGVKYRAHGAASATARL